LPNQQPVQSQGNPGNQPFQNVVSPNSQPYQPYPPSNYPNPALPTRPPYGNHPQPYASGSPFGSNPTLQNPRPYQTGFAPPQSFPSPYAPGHFVPPPPFGAPKSSLHPLVKIFLTLTVLGAVVGFAILRTLLSRERTESMGETALAVKYLKVPNRDSSSLAGMRENFLTYLGKDRDVRFGFDEMQKQLFQGINEIVYDEEKGEVLFLVWDCSEGDPTRVQRIIDRYAIDPAQVFYGESFKQKAIAFQGKTQRAWVNHCPLIIPINNIRINPYSSVEIKYASATYRVSAQELADYMTDKSVYSGPTRIFSKDRVQRELNVFGNHGAFVARPNEPSLTRLAGSLTPSGDSLSREGRIQNLLNFVSSEITYDEAEAKFKGEILKRPDETLLTRRGDCSSKTILMASLLEQIGEDYRLVYYVDHITVAVRQGGFKNLNTLSFSREGETWTIAETTVPGFLIGETAIENKSIFRNIQYIQRPGKSNEVSAFTDLKAIFFE
jgi:transglutaminase-like putative cysteine protease